MNKKDVKNRESASGGAKKASRGKDAASGGKDTASGGKDTASGGTDDTEVALGKYVSERKYKNRQIFNNRGRYDESESVDAEHAVGMKNDFADLLNRPSDCNFFQFKSEKNWENEAARIFSCQKFFNLNLNVLSHGLDCLPFYERVQMDKDALPQSDIEKCDKKMMEALEKYKKIRGDFVKELEENEKLSKSFEDLTGIKWEPRKPTPKVVEPEPDEEPSSDESDGQDFECGKFWLSHRTELKEKGGDGYLAPSSSSDESLELWLDTILDD